MEDESPAAGLLAVARSESGDLLVLGSGGHGSIAGRILGSTSYRISHQSPVPVVIVPSDR